MNVEDHQYSQILLCIAHMAMMSCIIKAKVDVMNH